MRTHFLRPGAAMPADRMSSQTRCKTNKGALAEVSGDIDDVDCGRCLALVKDDVVKGISMSESTSQKDLEKVYYPGSRIHDGDDGVGIGPDEKTFCGRRARTSEDAVSSSRKEDVTCRRCLARI